MLNLTGGRRRFPGLLLAVSAVALVVVAACGSEGSDQSAPVDKWGLVVLVEKVVALDQIFTFDDFLAAGFKKGKEYNVEGLEKATAAYYGFYGLDPYDRQEYEVRLYESHEDAVTYGIPMADEVTGEGAMLRDDNVTWHEGLKDRRQCLGMTSGGHHTHSCNTAKHADYVIRSNFVLMCQGLAADVSQQHCKDLLEAMGLQ